MTKQFKVYFSVDNTPIEGVGHDSVVIIKALHDKEAVLKFSKIFPTAYITDIIELSKTCEDQNAYQNV